MNRRAGFIIVAQNLPLGQRELFLRHALAHIAPDAHGIISRFQHPSLLLLPIGGHIRKVELDSYRLRGAGCKQLRFGVTRQADRALFQAALLVWRGKVYLHHILACALAAVGHLHLCLHRFSICGDRVDVPAEIRVGKAISKWILHFFRRKGFKIAVADIDAFLIFDIGFQGARIAVVAKISAGRMILHLVCNRIGQPAGGVHLACKHISHSLHANGARDADHQSCVNRIILLQPAHLRHIGHVEHHDNVPVFPRYIIKHCPLFLRQAQVLLCQIRAFRAGTAIVKDCRIRVLFRIPLHLCGHAVHRHLHLCNAAEEKLCPKGEKVFRAEYFFQVERMHLAPACIGGFQLGIISHARLLQRRIKICHIAAIDLPRASAAIVRLDRCRSKHVHLLPLQRQAIVFIL